KAASSSQEARNWPSNSSSAVTAGLRNRRQKRLKPPAVRRPHYAPMNADSRDRFLADFARVAPLLPGARVPWLTRMRQAGLERFAQSGFPSTRDEEWKYTNLAAIEKRDFQPVPQDDDVTAMSPTQFEALALKRLPGHRL